MRYCHLPLGIQPSGVAATSSCDPKVPISHLASKAVRQSGEVLSHRRLGLYICLGDCYICFPPCGQAVNYRSPYLASTYYI